MLSGGIPSWLAAKRTVEKCGPRNTVLLFADTRWESDDLYKFLIQVSADVGVPLTVVSDGRTPWEVFFDERFLGNSMFDPCSKILKRKLLDDWFKKHCDLDDITVVGLTWEEGDRLKRFTEKLAPREVEAPLYDPPYLSERERLSLAELHKLELPKLYRRGFPHNNCGGSCVKAGKSQWALLLKTDRERYLFNENKEQEIRAFLGRTDVTILNDRIGGKKMPLTLKEFRERIEAEKYTEEFEWGGCACAIE